MRIETYYERVLRVPILYDGITVCEIEYFGREYSLSSVILAGALYKNALEDLTNPTHEQIVDSVLRFIQTPTGKWKKTEGLFVGDPSRRGGLDPDDKAYVKDLLPGVKLLKKEGNPFNGILHVSPSSIAKFQKEWEEGAALRDKNRGRLYMEIDVATGIVSSTCYGFSDSACDAVLEEVIEEEYRGNCFGKPDESEVFHIGIDGEEVYLDRFRIKDAEAIIRHIYDSADPDDFSLFQASDGRFISLVK